MFKIRKYVGDCGSVVQKNLLNCNFLQEDIDSVVSLACNLCAVQMTQSITKLRQ